MKVVVAFLAGVVTALFLLVMVALSPESGQRVYDCSVAEFHPDYPPEVKAECRRLRSRIHA